MTDGYDDFWGVCNLTPAEAMARCPELQALVDRSEQILIGISMGWDLDEMIEDLVAALAAFTPLDPPPE